MVCKKKSYIKYAIVLIFVAAAGLLYSMTRPRQDWEIKETVDSSIASTASIIEEKTTIQVSSEASEIYVHVCGAVNHPGVYKGSGGLRVYQFIEMAGGIREDGAQDGLNMARTVSDGEQIYVFTQEEAAEKAGSWQEELALENPEEKESPKVDLNTAGETELTSLPGIGQAKAKAILAYRESHGKFTAIEELKNISGIKEATFEQIKGLITVKK